MIQITAPLFKSLTDLLATDTQRYQEVMSHEQAQVIQLGLQLGVIETCVLVLRDRTPVLAWKAVRL